MTPIHRSSTLALFLALALLSVCLTASAASAQTPTPTPYNYETRWFTVPLDHFNFAHMGETFQLRYLYNDEFYKPGGPIFFYTGNEANVESYCNNTGFIWDIAPEFNALVVFSEHRYYGESLPFGKDSYTREHLVHMSAEQALADYALLLTSLKSNMSILDAPVISFGGSYGGMLAAWFRLKYPHITAGSIAASAPVWMLDNSTSDFDAGNVARLASNVFRDVSQSCYDGIAASWDAMREVARREGGLQTLEDELRLCRGTLQKYADVRYVLFANWVSPMYGYLPMSDYPYPTSFITPLPGNPVNVVCSFWPDDPSKSDPIDLVRAVRATTNIFYNYSGDASLTCFNLSHGTGMPILPDETPWDYQTCTEMLLPQGLYGLPNDFFYVHPWNDTEINQVCEEQFGVTPRRRWLSKLYGSNQDWKTASNIVFSNGMLDPLRGGGVLQDISPTVVALLIERGAHHTDLRASNPLDPPSVVEARKQEVEWIRRFIANPQPQAGVGCDKDKLSTTAIVVISSGATLGAVLITALLYRFCRKTEAGSEDGYTQHI